MSETDPLASLKAAREQFALAAAEGPNLNIAIVRGDAPRHPLLEGDGRDLLLLNGLRSKTLLSDSPVIAADVAMRLYFFGEELRLGRFLECGRAAAGTIRKARGTEVPRDDEWLPVLCSYLFTFNDVEYLMDQICLGGFPGVTPSVVVSIPRADAFTVSYAVLGYLIESFTRFPPERLFPPDVPETFKRYPAFLAAVGRLLDNAEKAGVADESPPESSGLPGDPAPLQDVLARDALLGVVEAWHRLGYVFGWSKIDGLKDLLPGLCMFTHNFDGIALRAGYRRVDLGEGNERHFLYTISEVLRPVRVTRLEIKAIRAAMRLLPPSPVTPHNTTSDGAESHRLAASQIDQHSPVGSAKKQSRLKAHLDSSPPFISLDGIPFPSFSEVATRYVARLIEANGEEVSFAKWAKSEPSADGAVSTREFHKIPPSLAEFIGPTSRGVSARLRVDLLRISPS